MWFDHNVQRQFASSCLQQWNILKTVPKTGKISGTQASKTSNLLSVICYHPDNGLPANTPWLNPPCCKMEQGWSFRSFSRNRTWCAISCGKNPLPLHFFHFLHGAFVVPPRDAGTGNKVCQFIAENETGLYMCCPCLKKPTHVDLFSQAQLLEVADKRGNIDQTMLPKILPFHRWKTEPKHVQQRTMKLFWGWKHCKGCFDTNV